MLLCKVVTYFCSCNTASVLVPAAPQAVGVPKSKLALNLLLNLPPKTPKPNLLAAPQAVGVPKSKLALYTACGGIPPNMCLPICIDAGAQGFHPCMPKLSRLSSAVILNSATRRIACSWRLYHATLCTAACQLHLLPCSTTAAEMCLRRHQQ